MSYTYVKSPTPQEIEDHIRTARGPRQLYVEMPRIEPVNAIKMELETFAESIAAGRPPEVTLEDGYRALHVAEWISREIERLQDVKRL